MNNYELNLPPVKLGRNAKTGRFLKGHIPANKGKKWDEFMSKRAQKRAAKGWKNLRLHGPRAPYAGRNKKAVIAVLPDGSWCYFRYIGEAALKLNANRENIGRCCRLNEKGISPTRKKQNTDHTYKGIRWYFDTDNTWTTKIKQQ